MASPAHTLDPASQLGVGSLVVGDHAAIRQRLDQIEACLARVDAGEGEAFVHARQLLALLLRAVIVHNTEEEELLAPLLAPLAAWGPVRLTLLTREHRKQRRRAAELAAMDADTPVAHWAALMRSLGTQLRADMDSEEHDFLHPNALPPHAS